MFGSKGGQKLVNTQAEALEVRSTSGRYLELDALRGIAAFLVVINHLGFMFSYKPFWLLLPLFAGHESVILFFLLSGFVLSLPFWNKGRNGPYSSYLLRRFFRIYVPFAVALVTAAICAHFFLFSKLPLGGWFRVSWQSALTPSLLASQFLLAPTGQLNTAFWSLRYEVQLSIVFPMLLLLIRRIGSLASLIVALAMSLLLTLRMFVNILDFHWCLETIQYGSIFVVGAVLGQNRVILHQHWQCASRFSRIVFGGSAALLFFYGVPVLWHLHRLDHFFGEIAIMLGACGVILVSMFSQNIRNALRSRVPEFLGRISFSLYLTHATVMFTLVNLLYGKMSNLAISGIAVVVSLGVGYVFCLVVEEPALRLGKRLGTRKISAQVG
jgi:peptidoglycan/LPS O-acetylase OafA/YrhL